MPKKYALRLDLNFLNTLSGPCFNSFIFLIYYGLVLLLLVARDVGLCYFRSEAK